MRNSRSPDAPTEDKITTLLCSSLEAAQEMAHRWACSTARYHDMPCPISYDHIAQVLGNKTPSNLRIQIDRHDYVNGVSIPVNFPTE